MFYINNNNKVRSCYALYTHDLMARICHHLETGRILSPWQQTNKSKSVSIQVSCS